ncbi:flavodoxin [Peristeroidobacter soli]|uniref:flavodoxin n=1 Tax=Peristeroidobacter soli TaxID=2497877 RepID=UPI00101C857B|nr:flavodoxin [Peristeroidobacter soli]
MSATMVPNNLGRRAVMTAIAGLPMSGAAGKAMSAETRGSSHTLIAYFSRSGNTRVVAGLIQRALNADIFEIAPAVSYPADYVETVEQARRERDSGYEPALARKVPEMANYDTVFLGFPIWGETVPPVIRSFLSSHNLAGKSLIPFVTHGGYGLGSSLDVLARYVPQAKLLKGFSMQADQERQTMSLVKDWMRNGGIVR